MRLEARASVEAGRDRGEMRVWPRPEQGVESAATGEHELWTAREVRGRNGLGGEHRRLDGEQVGGRGLGGEDRHARDACGRHAVADERAHHGIEDRIGIRVGARAIADARPVGRGLHRATRPAHAGGDDARVGGPRRKGTAGQRQDGEHVRDARVDVELDLDRHGHGGRGVGAEHAVRERGGEHRRRRKARRSDRSVEEEEDGRGGPEAVEQVERLLDRVRVVPEHVDREPDGGAAVEERAVAVTRAALVEVEVVGEREGAERRRGRVQGG